MANNNSSRPVNTDVEYAGFWVRAGATIIDMALMAMIVFPLLRVFYGEDYFLGEVWVYGPGNAFLDGTWVHAPSDFPLGWVLPAVVVILFWIYKQATPGKMLVKAKIVDAQTGNNPSVGQCIGRYFAYFVSFILFGLGFIWIAFDERKQGWHDKLAGTVVIRLRHGRVPVSFNPQN